MMKMMGKVKELQEKMQLAQEELTHIVVEAEAGAGLVKVKVNGKKQIVDLIIDQSLNKSEDNEILRDLIIAAVNNGILLAEEKAKEHLQKATAGLMPNIPGFDFNNMV